MGQDFLDKQCGVPRWWQSPSLQYGPAYQSVSLTINLKQIYQVNTVCVRSAC